MRPNQQNNKQRSRGRNPSHNNSSNSNRRGGNPLSRSYESNGPDVRVRGNAAHIAEKYVQLARDAASSGDGVMAENYLQHAEHYFRIISAAQAQFNPPRQDQQVTDRDEDEDSQEETPRQQPASEAREPVRSEEAEGGEEAGAAETRPRRQRRPRRVQPEAEVNPEAAGASEGSPESAEAGAAEGEPAEGEAKPRRPRRPRRPRGAEEGTGELPAFLTEGGEAAAE